MEQGGVHPGGPATALPSWYIIGNMGELRGNLKHDVDSRVRSETHLAFGCGLGLTLLVVAGLLAYLWTM